MRSKTTDKALDGGPAAPFFLLARRLPVTAEELHALHAAFWANGALVSSRVVVDLRHRITGSQQLLPLPLLLLLNYSPTESGGSHRTERATYATSAITPGVASTEPDPHTYWEGRATPPRAR